MQATHGYVTVFQEDVIRHYQTHLAGRRAARAAREYRTPTGTEWAEFEEHFDKRKVELGNCGRPYATPCEHEHACIRCPLLQVDPVMIGRLDEINADLIARRGLAQTKGWLGELEGIDLTLRFLKTSAPTRTDSPGSAQPTSECQKSAVKADTWNAGCTVSERASAGLRPVQISRVEPDCVSAPARGVYPLLTAGVMHDTVHQKLYE